MNPRGWSILVLLITISSIWVNTSKITRQKTTAENDSIAAVMDASIPVSFRSSELSLISFKRIIDLNYLSDLTGLNLRIKHRYSCLFTLINSNNDLRSNKLCVYLASLVI